MPTASAKPNSTSVQLPTFDKTGRPPKLDDTMVSIIESLMAGGINRGVASEMMGIDRSTFYRWNRRGEEAQKEVDKHTSECGDDTHAGHWQHPNAKDELYRQFRIAVTRASALSVGGAAQRVYESFPVSWLKMSPEARQTATAEGWHSFEKSGTTVNVGVSVTGIMQGARETLSAAGRLPELAAVVAEAEANDVPGLDDDLPEVKYVPQTVESE